MSQEQKQAPQPQVRAEDIIAVYREMLARAQEEVALNAAINLQLRRDLEAAKNSATTP